MVMDYEIECPKHSGIFDIRTGEAKRLPPASTCGPIRRGSTARAS
jgi:nitrite reductase/ring-hydroxylating ferredoxin subunit